MEARIKRSLLARIDGQLAALERHGHATADIHWRRLQHAFRALAERSLEPAEAAFRSQLKDHLKAIVPSSSAMGIVQSRYLTLARTDCLLWQNFLRRRKAAPQRAR